VRGASAINGDVDEMVWVDWEEDSGERTMRFGVAKDLSPWDTVHFSLRQIDAETPGSFCVEWEPSRKPITAKERILRAMRRNPSDLWTMAQIRQDTGLNANTVAKTLERMGEEETPTVERIKPEGSGSIVYRLTTHETEGK
jgi:hypothetical protein